MSPASDTSFNTSVASEKKKKKKKKKTSVSEVEEADASTDIKTEPDELDAGMVTEVLNHLIFVVIDCDISFTSDPKNDLVIGKT